MVSVLLGAHNDEGFVRARVESILNQTYKDIEFIKSKPFQKNGKVFKRTRWEYNMKLAMVGPYPLDNTKIRGGVEAVLVNLVEGLKTIRELDIHVISCRKEIQKEKTVKYGDITLYYLSASRRFGNITFKHAEKSRIKKKIMELKPDIIHFHDYDYYDYTSAPAFCPSPITIHGIGFEETKIGQGMINRVRKCCRDHYERKTLSNAHDIIAISPYVTQAIGHLTPAEMHPIENPVNDKYFKLSDKSRRPRILFVGFISRLKNLLTLIKAIGIIKVEVPEVKVYVAGEIGEPDYFREIEQYIIKHELKNHVIFLGQLPEEKLMEEYENCAVLALVSLQENSPMAIQQAMAAGKAVVAARVGGVPNLVEDGRTGFLVNPGDVQGLAEKIKKILRHKELRERLGRNGKMAAQSRFDTQVIARKTYQLYQKLICEYKKG